MSNILRRTFYSLGALFTTTVMFSLSAWADATVTNIHTTSAPVDGFGSGLAILSDPTFGYVAASGMPTANNGAGGVSFRTTATASASVIRNLTGISNQLLGEQVIEYNGGFFVSASDEKAFYFFPPSICQTILNASTDMSISSFTSPNMQVMKILAPNSVSNPATASFAATAMALSKGTGSEPDLLIVADPDRSTPYIYFYDAAAIAAAASTNPQAVEFARVHEIPGIPSADTGYAIATNGQRIAYSSPALGNDAGMVHIAFRQSTAPYIQTNTQYFLNPLGNVPGAKFGQALAMRDDYLAVAAPYEDTPNCPSCSDNGMVRIYQWSTTQSQYGFQMDVGRYGNDALGGLGMDILSSFNQKLGVTQYRVQVGAPAQTQHGLYTGFHFADDNTPETEAKVVSQSSSWPTKAQLGRVVHALSMDLNGDGKTNEHFAVQSPVVQPSSTIALNGYMEQYESKFEVDPGNVSASVNPDPNIPAGSWAITPSFTPGVPVNPPGTLAFMPNPPVENTAPEGMATFTGYPIDGSYQAWLYLGEGSSVPGLPFQDISGNTLDIMPYQWTYFWGFILNSCSVNPTGPGCVQCTAPNIPAGCNVPSFIKPCSTITGDSVCFDLTGYAVPSSWNGWSEIKGAMHALRWNPGLNQFELHRSSGQNMTIGCNGACP